LDCFEATSNNKNYLEEKKTPSALKKTKINVVAQSRGYESENEKSSIDSATTSST
jgi:hypothetical protein